MLNNDKAKPLSLTANGGGLFVRRGYVLELGGAPYAIDVAELRAFGTWICAYRDAGFTANLDRPAQELGHPLGKSCMRLVRSGAGG